MGGIQIKRAKANLQVISCADFAVIIEWLTIYPGKTKDLNPFAMQSAATAKAALQPEKAIRTKPTAPRYMAMEVYSFRSGPAPESRPLFISLSAE